MTSLQVSCSSSLESTKCNADKEGFTVNDEEKKVNADKEGITVNVDEKKGNADKKGITVNDVEKKGKADKEGITVNDEENKGLNELMEQKMVRAFFLIISFFKIFVIFCSL